jgi:hypothetical protein
MSHARALRSEIAPASAQSAARAKSKIGPAPRGPGEALLGVVSSSVGALAVWCVVRCLGTGGGR